MSVETLTSTTYETVIGLEVHVQLATQSKAFCADSAKFGGNPNTHIGIVSLAMPGALPRANTQQIAYAVRLGMALGCKINKINYFDRKNYFYADLPKGYQITQDRQPICVGGGLEIVVKGKKKFIQLHHIHMEEDAGKSIHDQNPRYSLIDLNRAGVPLLEIVTMPDLRSGDEVDAFITAMRHLVRWLGISDGNMEEGSLRCDVNISIRPEGSTQFGTRCEVKNVNSMRFARRAIEYEQKRQQKVLENGGKVEQLTLNFNPETGVTTPIRDKENAHDYRYFPDPDLPPLVLSDEYLSEIRQNLPALPQSVRQELEEKYHLTQEDARILTEDRHTASFGLALLASVAPPQYKLAGNFLVQKLLPFLHEKGLQIKDFPIEINNLQIFLTLISENKISLSVAFQKLFPALFASPNILANELATQMNLLQTDDNHFLENVVKEVLTKNPEKVKEYKKGKKGLIGFFMGEVMKASKGKAEPKSTQALITKHLA